MYHYMTDKKGKFVLLVVLLAVSGTGGVLFSLVLAGILDCATAGNEGELLSALLLGVSYAVGYCLLEICYRSWKAVMIADARRCLKRDVFAGILGKSVAEFDGGNSGEYINELSNNINTFEEIYFKNIVRVLECAAAFCAAAAICIKLQPWMLVLMLFLALVTLGVSKLTVKPLEKKSESLMACTEAYMAEIKDDFNGFRLIKSFCIGERIRGKSEQKNESMERAKTRYQICQILCVYGGQLVGLLSTVIVMAVAAWCALRGMFSAGMVIAFGQLIGQIVSPVTALPEIIANFRASRPFQVRFRSRMQSEAKEGTECISGIGNGISLEKLSFGYSEGKEVLHELSYCFKAGGHYAVMGSSGSGKSTLLSLLAGDYSGYGGRILVDGRELRNLSEGCRSTLIGTVSQNVFLFNDTLRDNITLYGEYSETEILRAVEEAGLKEFAASLPEGLSTVVEENGKNFSGGERQRISLARAILRKSRVLLLDEFTANLDEKTAEEIENRLLSRKDCLMITVTHRLRPEILRQYDEILLIAGGTLAASGTYEEVGQQVPVTD